MPARPKRVLVAMSGGVDSSVAAALLVEAGHDVTGVTLKLWDDTNSGCCTSADAADARAVAFTLGIPYYVFDYRREFRDQVVDPVIGGYLEGVTPNPCIECNRSVKFSLLLDRARHLGCDLLATGHHARIDRTGSRLRLLRGTDPVKDQGYVLYMLGQADLASLVFPVGEMTKADVRAAATRLGLRTAAKNESQDVCFAGAGGMGAFLRSEAGDKLTGGQVRDADGTVLGTHDGAALFTVGQRRGVAVAAGARRYVTAVDVGNSAVFVGERHELESTAVKAGRFSWVSGIAARPGTPVEVQVRYGSVPTRARIASVEGETVTVETAEPVWAPAPGQALVLYSGDEVLGGGVITFWSSK